MTSATFSAEEATAPPRQTSCCLPLHQLKTDGTGDGAPRPMRLGGRRLPSLALAHSRSQRPIGRTLSVRTEFVYADAGAERSIAILGDWNGWRPMEMKREDEARWSATVRLDRGYHEFCFLVDGCREVVSTRHNTTPSRMKPGSTTLNWRNIRGGRPPAARPAQGVLPTLRDFLGGVGVISLHDDSGGLPSVQGVFTFPSDGTGVIGGGGGDEDATLAAADMVLHARIPILVAYIVMLYFSFVGLAVLARHVV